MEGSMIGWHIMEVDLIHNVDLIKMIKYNFWNCLYVHQILPGWEHQVAAWCNTFSSPIMLLSIFAFHIKVQSKCRRLKDKNQNKESDREKK